MVTLTPETHTTPLPRRCLTEASASHYRQLKTKTKQNSRLKSFPQQYPQTDFLRIGELKKDTQDIRDGSWSKHKTHTHKTSEGILIFRSETPTRSRKSLSG